MKKHHIISVLVIAFLVLGTLAVVAYGKGYRFWFEKGRPELSGTGLLVTKSNPDGAQVFINDHLTTATNNTISLKPGTYSIRISKEGYFTWEKTLQVHEEVVTKAESLLFPISPKLENITSTGVENPIMDPSLTKIAYTVASQSARKNGIYVLDIGGRPVIALQSGATQIADETVDQFSNAELSWSPSGKELLATISSGLNSPTTYLLKANQLNEAPQDVTNTIQTVHAEWEQDRLQKDAARLAPLKPTLKKLMATNFSIIAWSPDETKILYSASVSGTLPVLITPRLLGIDKERESRALTKGALYVYDIQEDTNFKIVDELEPKPQSPTPSVAAQINKSLAGVLEVSNQQVAGPQPRIFWFPDSEHVILVRNKRIEIVEADGSNKTTVYAGPFEYNYVFPWTNTSKFIVLTNLGNPDILPNLYTIGLQ